MDEYDNDYPMQDADFKALYLCLEHLLCRIHDAKEQLNEAKTAEEASGLQQKHDILMEEFHERLQDVETDSQRHYVMQNLPFSAKPKQSRPTPMKTAKEERQLGWHRTLSRRVMRKQPRRRSESSYKSNATS